MLLHRDPRISQLLLKLAALALTQHDDDWLTDYLRSTPTKAATQTLISAIEHNQSGHPQEAASEAKAALERFLRAGNRAGAARSQFEYVYALQRQSFAEQCRDQASSLERLLSARRYHWLDVQAELELASCDGMLARFDSALQHATRAAVLASSAKYPVLYLRAIGFQASIDAAAGRSSESWAANVTGLDRFWREANPADRGYQFYSELELEAEAGSRFGLAALLQREAITFAQESNRTDILAIGHFRLGSLFRVLGDAEAAEKEFRSSRELFSKLPQIGSTQLYKQYCDILLATLELGQGSKESAKDLLSHVNGSVTNSTNFSLQLAYWKAAAELAQQLADAREEQYLLKALQVSRDGLKSLHTDQEKWNWKLQTRDVYRRFIELSLAKSTDPQQRFALWQSYRLSEWGGHLLDSSALPARDLASISRQALQLHNSTLISYIVFPQHLSLWIADDRGMESFDIQISAVTLDALVRHFYRLCSDPSSNEQKVKAAGLRLYELLLAPVQSRTDLSRTVFIQPDGILGLVPWGALTGPNGKYLLETETIVSNEALMLQHPDKRMSRSSILAVYPGSVSFHGRKYLPLPDAEVEMTSIPPGGAAFLLGESATVPKVLESLTTANIFYFAGHADSDDRGGELILNGKKEGTALSASQISQLSLPRLRLVILAACNTAATHGNLAADPNALPHAFLKAGADQVIASRWEVDSSTTRALLTPLILANHGRAAATLRQGQLAVKQQLSHPYYWAGFQLYGKASK